MDRRLTGLLLLTIPALASADLLNTAQVSFRDSLGVAQTVMSNSVTVTVTVNSAAPLPPVLNWPSTVPLHGTLMVEWDPNLSVTSVNWIFSPVGAGGATLGNHALDGLLQPAFSTRAGAMVPALQSVSVGRYDVTVQLLQGTTVLSQNNRQIAIVSDQLSSVTVSPNPWRADKHATKKIQFAGLTLGTTIKLFTVSGHQIKELHTDGPNVEWDLTNDTGDRVAAGIYLYLITDTQGDKTRGKLAVIR